MRSHPPSCSRRICWRISSISSRALNCLPPPAYPLICTFTLTKGVFWSFSQMGASLSWSSQFRPTHHHILMCILGVPSCLLFYQALDCHDVVAGNYMNQDAAFFSSSHKTYLHLEYFFSSTAFLHGQHLAVRTRKLLLHDCRVSVLLPVCCCAAKA